MAHDSWHSTVGVNMGYKVPKHFCLVLYTTTEKKLEGNKIYALPLKNVDALPVTLYLRVSESSCWTSLAKALALIPAGKQVYCCLLSLKRKVSPCRGSCKVKQNIFCLFSADLLNMMQPETASFFSSDPL